MGYIAVLGVYIICTFDIYNIYAMKNIFTLSLFFTTIVSYSQTFVSTTPENKNVVDAKPKPV